MSSETPAVNIAEDCIAQCRLWVQGKRKFQPTVFKPDFDEYLFLYG